MYIYTATTSTIMLMYMFWRIRRVIVELIARSETCNRTRHHEREYYYPDKNVSFLLNTIDLEMEQRIRTRHHEKDCFYPDKDKNDADTEHTRIYYTMNNQSYCMIADGVRDITDIETFDDDEVEDNKFVVNAVIRKEGKSIDVTEKTRMIAGPRCDFHNEPLDLYWVFKHDGGELFITFEDYNGCTIELSTNTVISGDATRVPLL